MPIDYGMIRDIGGAEARGRSRALDIQAKELAQQDYLAHRTARARVGGTETGFYERQLKGQQYAQELQALMPIISKSIQAGDRANLEAIGNQLREQYPDFHKSQMVNLIPGQKMDLQTIVTGADMIEQDPRFQGKIDPGAQYLQQSEITADGQVRVTNVKPYIPKTGKPGPGVRGSDEFRKVSKQSFDYIQDVLKKPDEYGMVYKLDDKTARQAALYIDDLIAENPDASPQRIGEMAIQKAGRLREEATEKLKAGVSREPSKTAPRGQQKTLTREKAQEFMTQARGNKAEARRLAKEAGYSF